MTPLEQLEKPLTKAQKARVVAAVRRAKTGTEIAQQLGIAIPAIHQTKGLGVGTAQSQTGTPELAPHAAHAAINPTLEKIRSGISLGEFMSMAKKYGLSQEDFGRKVGMSATTLARRKRSNAALAVDESDRLIRYQRIFDLAVQLFDGNEENARSWLKYPQRALAYQRPIDVAETEQGAREVENVIGCLEYGLPL